MHLSIHSLWPSLVYILSTIFPNYPLVIYWKYGYVHVWNAHPFSRSLEVTLWSSPRSVVPHTYFATAVFFGGFFGGFWFVFLVGFGGFFSTSTIVWEKKQTFLTDINLQIYFRFVNIFYRVMYFNAIFVYFLNQMKYVLWCILTFLLKFNQLL